MAYSICCTWKYFYILFGSSIYKIHLFKLLVLSYSVIFYSSRDLDISTSFGRPLNLVSNLCLVRMKICIVFTIHILIIKWRIWICYFTDFTDLCSNNNDDKSKLSKFPWLSNWVLFIKLLITHPLHLPEINDFIVLTSVNLFWNFIEILDQIIKIWDLIHFNNWNSILIHFTKEFWLCWQEESYYVIRHIN